MEKMRVLTFCSSHFIEYAEHNNSYSMMDSRWKKFKTENLLHAEHDWWLRTEPHCVHQVRGATRLSTYRLWLLPLNQAFHILYWITLVL